MYINSESPPGNPSGDSAHSYAYIARQPIIKDGDVFGYELYFRSSADSQVASIEDELVACANVIINVLSEMGVSWLFNDKVGFINVSRATIMSGLIEVLPSKSVVLEVDPQLEITEDIMIKCSELSASGYKFAIDIHTIAKDNPLLALCSHVKGDVKDMDQNEVLDLVSELKERGIVCVAERVETQEQFDQRKAAGFDMFQGYFFAKPENLSVKTLSTSCSVVMDLMALVSADADIAEIEACLKKDVSLSFKLLKYINSVGFGMSCEIHSVKHAIAIIGHAQLYKWLTLLLATANSEYTTPVIARNAIIRGRLCELLGQMYLTDSDLDNLFVVGVFSMLSDMLQMPVASIMSNMALPETVEDAILNDAGIYAPFLELAVACEGGDREQINEVAENLAIDTSTVNRCHLQAIAWTENLGI